MKITGLMSSPRKTGNTAIMLDEVLAGAKQCGAQTERINLAEYNINFCRGCLGCMATGRCHMKDDFEQVKEKLKESDGIVFGSPTYMADYNAVLRKFFERLGLFEHMTSEIMGGKYIAGISAGGGTTGKTVKSLKQFAVHGGVFDRGFFSGGVGLAVMGKNALDFPEKLKNCRKLGERLVFDILTCKQYRVQGILLRSIKHILIAPGFKKIITKNRNSSQKAVYEYLSVNGKIIS